MVKRFSVRSENDEKTNKSPLLRHTLVITVPVVASCLLSAQWFLGFDFFPPIALAGAIASLPILSIVSHQREQDDDKVVEVAMYPLGIQLTTMIGTRTIGIPIFLPRGEIFDCVVSEVILAHKVVSIVLFRLQDSSSGMIEKNSTVSPFRLVEAFPGVEMRYEECLYMRNEIMKWL